MSLSVTLSWILGILLAGILVEAIRITWYLTSSRRVINIAEKFEQHNPTATQRILFVGDSVGCSTGASHARYSLAGRMGADFPDTHIENRSEGQMRLSKANRVLQEVCNQKSTPFDMAIIQIGGMDLVSGTPLRSVQRLLHEALRVATECGRAVVLIGPNNPGLAPLYRFPLSRVYHSRARKFDRLYQEAAATHGAYYVSLFEEQADPLAAHTLFAPDKTHPNSEGYGIWYNKMKATFANVLNQHDGHPTIEPRRPLEG